MTKNINNSMKKRLNNIISWNEFFLGVAFLSACRSKDPNTQVGACIINKNNQIISTGYNGTIHNFSDDDVLWNNDDERVGKNKYSYLVDAEINAIINALRSQDLSAATIYITHYPCNNCLKMILQCGITRIFYCIAKHNVHYENQASLVMIKRLKIKITKLNYPTRWIRCPE